MSECLTVGMLLGGRYEIIEKIGSGGMAMVYKAKCRLLQRFVAVKVLRAEYKGDQEFIKRFDVEAQAAASLTHPNIVSIYDTGRDGEMHYIVMEYVEGITLKQYIAKHGQLDWQNAVRIASQICSALDCAHKNHIIHHDIKPHNILMTGGEVAKVTDFGIARAASSSTMVVSSSTIGSVHYFAPEQARGGYTDEKSDIYSVGIVLYEMLTGKVPFDGDSAVAVALMHVQNTAISPRLINIDVTENVERIVMKAMAKEPRNRYQCASDMLKDLTAVLENRRVSVVDQEETIVLKHAETSDIKNSQKQRAKNVDKGKDTGISTGKKEKKRMSTAEKVGMWIAIALVAVILGGATWLMLDWTGIWGRQNARPNEIEVPYIEGMDIEEARRLYKDKGITLSIIEEKEDTEREKGEIISQRTQAGNIVKTPVTIMVIVSSGNSMVKVPNLGNMDRRTAEKMLADLQLTSVIVYESSDVVPKDAVIRQEPSPDVQIKKGESVRVYISDTGEGTIKTPSVVGKTLISAKTLIENSSLTLGTVSELESDKPVGTVIDQSPEEGMKLPRKGAVNLVISKGPKPTQSPTPTPSAAPPPGQTKTQTITIPLSQEKATTHIKIISNDIVKHDQIHNKTEGVATIPIEGTSGSGEMKVSIYIDGVLKETKTLTF